MEKQREIKLEQFRVMSKQILKLAQTKKWDEVSVLELQRKVLMLEAFGQSFDAADAPQISELINEVLSMNSRVTDLAEQEKMTVSEQLQGLKKSQNALFAYQENS